MSPGTKVYVFVGIVAGLSTMSLSGNVAASILVGMLWPMAVAAIAWWALVVL